MSIIKKAHQSMSIVQVCYSNWINICREWERSCSY